MPRNETKLYDDPEWMGGGWAYILLMFDLISLAEIHAPDFGFGEGTYELDS